MSGHSGLMNRAAELNNLDDYELQTLLGGIAEVFENLERHIFRLSSERGAAEQEVVNTIGEQEARIRKPAWVFVLILFGVLGGMWLLPRRILEEFFTGGFTGNGFGVIDFVILFGGAMAIIIVPMSITHASALSKRKQEARHEVAVSRQGADNKLAIIQQKEDEIIQEVVGELSELGVTVDVIPNEYRRSYILRQFCNYLSMGTASSWKECVNKFQQDMHNAAMRDDMQRIISQNDNMLDSLNSIKQYTKINAIFTGYIASKI